LDKTKLLKQENYDETRLLKQENYPKTTIFSQKLFWFVFYFCQNGKARKNKFV
jgi:hypothetical protein